MPLDFSSYKDNFAPADTPAAIGKDLMEGNTSFAQNKLLQTQNETAQADLSMQKFKNLAARITPLAVDPNLSHKKIIDATVEALADGSVDMNQAKSFLGSLGDDTPEHNRIIMNEMLMRVNDGAKQLEAATKTPSTINVGDTTYQGATRGPLNPLGAGGFEPDTEAQLTVTPEFKASRVEYLGPNKEKKSKPQSALTDRYGYPNKKNPLTNDDAALENEYNAMAAKQGPATVAKPDQAEDGTLTISPPAGYEGDQRDSQDRTKKVRQEAIESSKSIPVLEKIYNLSRDVGTGNTTNYLNSIKNTLAANGVSTDKMKTEAATYDELGKYMAQFTQGGGTRSDEDLKQVRAGNPNDKMLPQTIQNVSRAILSYRTADIAKQNAMEKYLGNDLDPAKEKKFNNIWTKIYDSRAVELTLMRDSDERKKYFEKLHLSSKDRDKVMDSFREMRKLGAFD